MRLLIGILILLFVAASGALIVVRNPGYVLIAREPFVLETSLAVFVILLVAAFALLYSLARISVRLLHAPRDLGRWRQTRRTRRARQAFHEGLKHLISGDAQHAEKSLVASLHASDSPYLANLAAALAAQEQHNREKRDRYLMAARQQTGESPIAAELLQARLQILDRRPELAHATLAHILEQDPKQPAAQRLMITVARQLRDWHGLTQLLSQAHKHRWLPEPELREVELETHLALLNLDLPDHALDTLHQAWSLVPAARRDEPSLIAAYARQLTRQRAPDEALKLVEAALAHQWDELLVRRYGHIAGTNPAAQLEQAQDWLTHHGESAALLLTLGRLARRAAQTDQAVRYLERSLALGGGSEAHAELAALLESSGEPTRALEHYRRALALAGLPD
jgi:HemY protein